ncbi:hypothetical protein NKW53_07725 [Acetobacter orientalis]|uniref:hypothetical protein n=1 Tax=Acetobacter orientalis TaxID=146474 RepID=UPI00209E08CD|nr:hypothetical protein [Acetobacter orientalis]MCP1215948.1 hypothetical protein [Acetobacter orientalis]MCP1217892.1 hypothetical protein [Acetobacter orientalis]
MAMAVGTGAELRTRLIEDYLKDVKRDPTGTRLVLARTHNEVRNLNADLRNLLRQEGRIAGADIEIEALSRGLKPVAGSLFLATGDRLIFGENIKASGHMIRNNDVATIRDVCRDNTDGQPVVTLAFDRGFEVTTRWSDLERLSRSRGNEPDTRPLRVQHAYPVTVHSAQGASVDRSYVLNAAGLDKESLYVGMTRHKEDCHLYVDATRIGLNVRDNRIRRDGVPASISASGQLEAPDALDKDDPGDKVDRDAVIKQIIYEGEQSREKGNAADFSQHRQSWASAPTAEMAVHGEIERKRIEIERKKEDGPSSVELESERIEEWILGPDGKGVREFVIPTTTDGDAEKAAAEARRKEEEEEEEEEEARKRAQEGPVMRR